MKNKYKVVAGSLVGAVVIHAALIACSGGGGNGDKGARNDAGSLGEPGDDGGTGIVDAMLDALSRWVDGTTPDARADTDGGACGCTVQGSLPSVPASESATQLVGGNVTVPATTGSSSAAVVATGPFVLTDATSGDLDLGTEIVRLVVQPAAATCVAPVSSVFTADPGLIGSVFVYRFSSSSSGSAYAHDIHGGRYLVPSGKMLCAISSGNTPTNVAWAGFKPY